MVSLGEIYAGLESPLAKELAKTHGFPIEKIFRGAPKAHWRLSRRGREIERDEQESMKE